MADGLIEPTFRWRDQIHGAHAGDREHNDHGIGICLVGNFENHPPTPRQVASASDLIEKLAARYSISSQNVIAHSKIVATECPGKHFPLATLSDAASQASKIRTATADQKASPQR
jgi:N-acetyl-anhydromuramyl-L-alanine amidase AmpD